MAAVILLYFVMKGGNPPIFAYGGVEGGDAMGKGAAATVARQVLADYSSISAFQPGASPVRILAERFVRAGDGALIGVHVKAIAGEWEGQASAFSERHTGREFSLSRDQLVYAELEAEATRKATEDLLVVACGARCRPRGMF
jgi:hypothetical protein